MSSNGREYIKKRLCIDSFGDYRKFPKYFQIEATDKCNANCLMCSKSISKNPHMSTMTKDLYNKILSEIEPYSDWIEMITIQWMGEPLLDPLLEWRISEAKEIGIKRVSISTNASLLSKDRCMMLFRAGLDDLRISIDSIEKSTYEEIRRGLRFDDVINNTKNAFTIRNIENPNAQIRIRMVDMEKTHNQIDDWKLFWKPYLSKNDLIQIMPLNKSANWNMGGAEAKDIMQDKYSDINPCISLFSTMIINAEGRIALCCVDSEFEMEIGNINNDTIWNIWNGNKLNSIRDKHLNDMKNSISICKGCNAWSENKYEELN